MHRVWLERAALLLLFVGGGWGAEAQSQGCEEALAHANEAYAAQAFTDVETWVGACLSGGEATGADSVAAHRLLARTFLYLGDLASARSEVIKLLAQQPDYRPDGVRDLPAFVSLVTLVREQLGVTPAAPLGPVQRFVPGLRALESAPLAEIIHPLPHTLSPVEFIPLDTILADSFAHAGGAASGARPLPRAWLEAGGGITHYGGERGIATGNWFSDLRDNAGGGVQLGVAFPLAERVQLGFVYNVGHFPGLLRQRGAPPAFERIDPGGSTAWLNQVSAVVRIHVLPSSLVSPYAMGGVTATMSLLNDTFRVGLGPRFGLGVEGWVTSRMAVFLEAQSTIAFPGRAADLARTASNRDFLSGVQLGLRYGF